MFGRKQQMKYNINTYQIYFKENKIFTSPKNLIVYKEHTFNFQKKCTCTYSNLMRFNLPRLTVTYTVEDWFSTRQD